ncbi:hypothetical protein [Arthrobacter sp. C9C5]|uniref:hypothetical protein n=1 Tax=Arthrobacter sp. C9C5 TaxID=2735267 RepID=UPI001585AF43|nr:hypothetical protein [Arthrobacter sp. C9C5]NUU31168.1 hypothetical protein [Arthrobacter sp. C9C5]
MNSIIRNLGAALSALVIVAGTVACGANSSGPAYAPPAGSSAAAPAAEVVQHKPAEVKKVLDAFLQSVSNESDAYMKAAMAGGSTNDTPEEKAAKFKSGFPESYKYLDLDDKKAAGLIGIFALVAMLTPDTEMSANESGIALDGETATIRGSDIKIKGIEKSGQGGSGGKLGKITLTFQESTWKITDLEIQQ